MFAKKERKIQKIKIHKPPVFKDLSSTKLSLYNHPDLYKMLFLYAFECCLLYFSEMKYLFYNVMKPFLASYTRIVGHSFSICSVSVMVLCLLNVLGFVPLPLFHFFSFISLLYQSMLFPIA